jgi:tetratricopeptide (TPR) repeat protein
LDATAKVTGSEAGSIVVQESSLPAAESSVQSPSRNSGRTVTVIFALIAVIAIGAAVYFWRGQQTATAQLTAARAQATRAQQNFKAGEDAVDAIVSDLAQSGGNFAGTQAPNMAAILARVESSLDALASESDNDLDVRRRQAVMYVAFSPTYLALGDTKLAVDSARKGTDIFRALAAAQPNNSDMQSNVGLSLQKLGEALRASGDMNGALAADRESLDVARTLAARDPGNKQFRTDVVLALWRLAAVGDDPRARLTEALKILNNLKLAAILTPAQEEWIAMIASELAKL